MVRKPELSRANGRRRMSLLDCSFRAYPCRIPGLYSLHLRVTLCIKSPIDLSVQSYLQVLTGWFKLKGLKAKIPFAQWTLWDEPAFSVKARYVAATLHAQGRVQAGVLRDCLARVNVNIYLFRDDDDPWLLAAEVPLHVICAPIRRAKAGSGLTALSTLLRGHS